MIAALLGEAAENSSGARVSQPMIKRWLAQNWFLAGMAASVVLAGVFPRPGAAGGVLHPAVLTKAGVALIFFLHGATLSFASFKAGAMRWPLHVLVQATTFLLFPLIGLGVIAALDGRVSADLRLGIFYLCALPSTVSSSVAMTAAARGNVAAAVFNATLSSLLGIFLTPMWVGAVASVSGAALPIGSVMLDLLRWLVLPLVFGHLSRPWTGRWMERHQVGVHVADRVTILLLVYTSFCDSFVGGVWSDNSGMILVALVGFAGLLFTTVMLFTALAATALRFPTEDKIAAMFCGSKKTLASGVPMAKLMFGGNPGLGLILLPIMIYHPLQLILCGVLVNWWKRKDHAESVRSPA